MAFKKIKNVVCAEIYQNSILLHLRLDPDTVELEPGRVEDVRGKGHWGTGDLRVYIRDLADFDRTKSLLDRAYAEN